MTREFIYIVNGSEFNAGADVWGQAWKDAQAQAAEEHSIIERAVISGENINYEFYAKGGCFLADKFYSPDLAKVF